MERGYLYAIGAAVTWGLMYVIEEKILTRLPPMTLFFINSVLMSIFTLPFFLHENGFVLFGKERGILLWIVFAVLLGTIANFFILSSIKILGASTASSFEISYPFFVAIFSVLLLGKQLSLAAIAGGILIFLGSLIVIRYG